MHLLGEVLELLAHALQRRCLARPRLPVDEDVGGRLAPEGGDQDFGDGVDLLHAVRQVVRRVRRPQHFAVREDDLHAQQVLEHLIDGSLFGVVDQVVEQTFLFFSVGDACVCLRGLLFHFNAPRDGGRRCSVC